MKDAEQTRRVRFQIPGDSRYLFLVRTVVTALARDAGLPEEEVDRIEIAVDEACTNVLDHAYRQHAPKPPIELQIDTTEAEFVVDVIDRGTAFDFAAYVPPQFPDHWMDGQTRGVGLYLIKQCMDEILYDRLPEDRNRFRLIKRIPSRARGAETGQPVGAG